MAATNVSHADSHQNLSVTVTEMNSNIGLLTKFLKQFVEGGGYVKNRS